MKAAVTIPISVTGVAEKFPIYNVHLVGVFMLEVVEN